MRKNIFTLLLVFAFLLLIMVPLASCKNAEAMKSNDASSLISTSLVSEETMTGDLISSENGQTSSSGIENTVPESKIANTSNINQQQLQTTQSKTPSQPQSQAFTKSSLANSSNVGMIYEFGGKLFYKNNSGYLCTRNSDGTNETVIVAKYVSHFEVSSNYGYYIIGSGDIYRFSLSNTADVQKYSMRSYNIAVSDNYLYYDDTSHNLYRVNADGSGDPLVITKNCGPIFKVFDNFIFYLFDDKVHDKYQLCRAALDGSNSTIITNGPIGYFCCYNNQLYFDTKSGICRSNMDGSGIFNTGAIGYNINASDGKIYYLKADSLKDAVLYSMNPDGSNNQEIG